MNKIKTPWDGHWRLSEYLGFVQWAMAQAGLRAQYRQATGDQFEPAASGKPMEEQIESGQAMAWLQRYSDWLAENVFGMPADVDDIEVPRKETIH